MKELLRQAKINITYKNLDGITKELNKTTTDAINSIMGNFIVPLLTMVLLALFVWQLIGLANGYGRRRMAKQLHKLVQQKLEVSSFCGNKS